MAILGPETFQTGLYWSVLVQGDVIDRVEQHVLHSGAHLEKGRGHLQGAGRRQKAARKVTGIKLVYIGLYWEGLVLAAG
uniref:t-SNARE coiled-coil homology domain-containing protein n=1 Tax=Junco hyemalis TaxID=40217 RepID=A0A8C5IXJ3_JUNHY